MVRKVWVLVALVAGLLLGFFLTTYGAYVLGFSTGEADGRTARAADNHAAATFPATPEMIAPATTVTAPETVDAPVPAPTPDTGHLGADVAQYSEISTSPSGQIEFKDPLHEEFLREERDDSWAYLREAELENSMLMELSEGHFRKDRIECRASICEVELSATGDQVAKLSEWMDEKNKQRGFSLEEPLMMRGSSFSGDSNKGRARILYMKPQRVMSPPKRG